MPATPATIDRVRTVLRTSLKLGDDADLPDAMPLIGGDFDLDSLDMLLLITNIEKEFAFKIPNEAVGKAAFETLASLAAFVEKHRG